jgi:hypothetical protein
LSRSVNCDPPVPLAGRKIDLTSLQRKRGCGFPYPLACARYRCLARQSCPQLLPKGGKRAFLLEGGAKCRSIENRRHRAQDVGIAISGKIVRKFPQFLCCIRKSLSGVKPTQQVFSDQPQMIGGLFNFSANLAGIITPIVIGLIVSANRVIRMGAGIRRRRGADGGSLLYLHPRRRAPDRARSGRPRRDRWVRTSVRACFHYQKREPPSVAPSLSDLTKEACQVLM